MRLHRYYLSLIIISLIPLLGFLLNPLLFHTHDGLVHLARIGAYFKALSDFQLPVRWAGDLNYGYGLPLFNFMYPLPYFVASIFVLLGAGLVNSFKFTLALSFVLSAIFMFGFSRALLKDNNKAFFVTIFYQFMPFRIVELLVRGSFGEVYTYAFLPLALWGLILLFKKQNLRNIFLTSLGVGFLIISHNAISLVFFAVIVLFIAFFGKSLKNYIFGSFSVVLGLLLASFYWLPALMEHKYTYGDLFMKKVYLDHFPPIQNFFIPNFFNNPSLFTGGVSVQFGLFHTIALLSSIFILLRYKKISSDIKRLIIFSFVILVVSLFLMQPLSTGIWENLSLLRQFQFPWRLLSVSGFALSLLSVSFFSFNFFKNKIVLYLILFLLIISTIHYWKPSLGMDKIDEKFYWNFPQNTTYYGETDLIWSKGPQNSYPKNRVDIIAGKGSVSDFFKKSNLQTFTVLAQTPIDVVSRTQYFPGWKAFVNGVSVPIQFQDQNWRGQIVFSIPKGEHQVKVAFGENKIRFFADLLSLLSIILLIVLAVFCKSLRLT